MEKHVVRWTLLGGRLLLILLIGFSTLYAQASTRTLADASSRAGITFKKGSGEDNSHLVDGEWSSPSNNENHNNSKKRLPQTGEEKSSNLGFFGIFLLLLLSVWLVINRKRNEREK